MSSSSHSSSLSYDSVSSSSRSHRGNVPSLPQNKYCSLCPAKFTRTAHLNRHLRSHANERRYQCDRCTAEFTRSDLLSRHKRKCGLKSMNASGGRSRKKSCESCVQSKVKCDRQAPCSRCIHGGKQCIYANGHYLNKGALGYLDDGINLSPDASSSSSSCSSPDSIHDWDYGIDWTVPLNSLDWDSLVQNIYVLDSTPFRTIAPLVAPIPKYSLYSASRTIESAVSSLDAWEIQSEGWGDSQSESWSDHALLEGWKSSAAGSPQVWAQWVQSEISRQASGGYMQDIQT
ncbi:hypothetical protein C8J56DRAFT_1067286 [Mycena floridula]|nr:hypothetical protein C8J56DRAFT_1067286 [Mycena floridula]